MEILSEFNLIDGKHQIKCPVEHTYGPLKSDLSSRTGQCPMQELDKKGEGLAKGHICIPHGMEHNVVKAGGRGRGKGGEHNVVKAGGGGRGKGGGHLPLCQH